MGAVSVSELAAMYPEAGGFRVYARRAYGDRAGFVVGWIDRLASVATPAYASVSAIEFVGTLWPTLARNETVAAVALLGVFTVLHSSGVRMGSTITSVASATIGTLLLVLIVACLLAAPAAHGTGRGEGAVRVLSVPTLAAAKLPVAAASQIVLPRGSASLMTALSILIVLGLINGNAIMGPRLTVAPCQDAGIYPRT